MSEFWRLVVPSFFTAVDGLGYSRGRHRMNRTQKGNHERQAEGKGGDGRKKREIVNRAPKTKLARANRRTSKH